MMDSIHARSISRRAWLVGISRGSVYDVLTSVSVTDQALMRCMDALHLEHPFYGVHMLRDQLNREGPLSGVNTGATDGLRGHGGAGSKTWHQKEAFRA